ncbi:4313_t:CDS:2 [Paraglomus occultum]|uniref:4313_t:CDS:1 n=1 Tax=Paraglomus occultum TaxID=144539 RepID=A0A9N8ZIS2_9GLOM|nr:4313_t:CDS:2 [Paraglomus occultum]
MSAIQHPLSLNTQSSLNEPLLASDKSEVATVAPSEITDLENASLYDYANNDCASDRALLITKASLASLQTVGSHNSGHARCHSESAVPTEDGLATFDKMNRRITYNDINLKQLPQVDYIDQLDITGIYGGALFHHESPYDRALSYHTEASAQVFGESENVFPTTHTSSPYDENSYVSYEPNPVRYRDSFLEGSTAYGFRSNDDDLAKIKRKSFFKRISRAGFQGKKQENKTT